MSKQLRVFILGPGAWGVALSLIAADHGYHVTLWSPFDDEIAALTQNREQTTLLPGVRIPDDIALTTDMSGAADADLIIMAVPSSAVRQTAARLKGIIKPGALIANVSKGLEEGTLLRLSQVITSELPDCKVVALSGPSHAEEVARGVPTSVVSSCAEAKPAKKVQDILMNETLRIYTNPDIIGVELGGALKNVIALTSGVADGLGLGDNTKAAVITRGLSEIARLGAAMGARRETFAGLTGIGDLVVTCTSMHSRNRRFGILIGQMVPPDEALRQIGQTVEGYGAAKNAYTLAKQYHITMPITEYCYRILYERASPKDAIRDLMARPKKHEEHPFSEKKKDFYA